MNPLIGSSLIGAAGSFFGGLFGSSSSRKAQESANRTNLQIARETNAARMELAKYAYSQDLEMWNKQNEYNNPANQMQRLTAAGLNPNLVYGSGSITGNTVGSAPSFKSPELEAPRVQSIGGYNFGDFGASSLLSYYIGQSQVKQYQAQEAEIRSRAANNAAANAGIVADSLSKVIKADVDEATKSDLIDGLRANYQNNVNQAKLSENAVDMLPITNEILTLKRDILSNKKSMTDTEKEFYRTRLLAILNSLRAQSYAAVLNAQSNSMNAETSRGRLYYQNLSDAMRSQVSMQELENLAHQLKVIDATYDKVSAEARKSEYLNEFYYKRGFVPGEGIQATGMDILKGSAAMLQDIVSWIF